MMEVTLTRVSPELIIAADKLRCAPETFVANAINAAIVVTDEVVRALDGIASGDADAVP